MQDLLDGYRAFRRNLWPDLRSNYEENAELQQPSALVIACADSRVDPQRIFNAGPGQIFVVRNVANLVPPYEQGDGLHGTSAAIEFAVTKLQVQTILVMGHARCGGVAAALDRSIGADSVFIRPWISLLDPAVDRISREGDAHTALERESIVLSMERLRAFPFIADAIRERGLIVAGARFGITTGQLELYDETAKTFQIVT